MLLLRRIAAHRPWRCPLPRCSAAFSTSATALSQSLRDIVRQGTSDGAAAAESVTATGWIRTVRGQKNDTFLTLNDGSSFHGLQVVLLKDAALSTNDLRTGASVRVSGLIVPCPNPKPGQEIELHASSVEVIGACDPSYPLQKKFHSLEFLREICHLRFRTNTHGAVLRTRNAATVGLHNFFQNEGFVQVHTPIITPLDCEGAGELFEVSVPPVEAKAGEAPLEHFFKSRTYLTVSGQLYAEMLAAAVRNVYTFGPTFRAENSHTTRHLAEFWMLEPEVAFADLNDVLHLAERCIKSVLRHVIESCPEDMEFFNQRVSKGGFVLACSWVEQLNRPSHPRCRACARRSAG